jgi:hypothetical protein
VTAFDSQNSSGLNGWIEETIQGVLILAAFTFHSLKHRERFWYFIFQLSSAL